MSDFQRHFTIETLNDICLDGFCVYKIWFGCHFYIGSSTNPERRIAMHMEHINLTIENGFKYGENSVTSIANHLMLHPYIKTAFFEVLEICISEGELVEVEYSHLREAYGSPFCLNISKGTSRKIGNKIYMPSKTEQFPIEAPKVRPKPINEDLVFMKMLRKSLINLGIT